MTNGETGMTCASAHTSATDLETVTNDLVKQLTGEHPDPTLVVFFCGHRADGAAVADGLAKRLPTARVIGCSTAGEFNEHDHSLGGAAAIAFPRDLAPKVATALADLTAGVPPAVAGAVASLERQFGMPLRDLDPERYVGLVLIDGLHGHEEEVNAALGAAAPFLSFIGGSAGDDLEFTRNWVAEAGNGARDQGVALAVLELTVPFAVLKTCSLEPTAHGFTVTRSDAATRTLYELDEQPVLDVYSAAVGVPKEKLDTQVFMAHPFGVMIDGQPWIRSPQRVTADGGLKLYCQLPADTKVHLMRTTALIQDTRTAVAQVRAQLGGGRLGGAVLFNCILRRLALDSDDSHKEFLAIFEDLPMGGFHTYGESWIGHMNQTCTGLILGDRTA